MSDFGTLKANVASAIGRADVPSFVYDLAQAEISARFRLREMEAETTILVNAETEALPADFLSVRALWHDDAYQTPLEAVSEFANAALHYTGRPAYYTISGTNIRFAPAPDGNYTLRLRYVARTTFVADSDTSTMLTRYPALYLYAALKHAAIWAQDTDLATAYAAAYEGEAQRVEKQDMAARYPGPLSRRASAAP